MSKEKLPPAANGLQLNFCKTVSCGNYNSTDEIHYYVLKRSFQDRSELVCGECGAFLSLLNNHGVLKELSRLKAVQSLGLPACCNPDCENLGKLVFSHRDLYHSFGHNGEHKRYRCKYCQVTFTDQLSSPNQNHPLQRELLALVLIGYSVVEVCQRLNISTKYFYSQLSHIASLCRRQLSMFDTTFFNQHSKSLTFSSDIKPFQPNYQNGILWVATCEANSGYVVGQHLNYSEVTPTTSSVHHCAYSPDNLFMAPVDKALSQATQDISHQGILARINATHNKLMARSNVEEPISDLIPEYYPLNGGIIRPQYAVYAHFLRLEQMLVDNEYLAIYMPQEGLLRSACLSVFQNKISNKTIDLVYVAEDHCWKHGTKATQNISTVLLGSWLERWAIVQNGEASKGVCHLNGRTNNERKLLEVATHREASKYQRHFHNQFSHLLDDSKHKLNPASLLPLLDIHRAWYNLCLQDRLGQTPAQKMRLTSLPLTLDQLLSN